MSAPATRLRLLESITDVPPADWAALLGPSPAPFVRHAWLAAMEDSGSATPETGWTPRHLTLWRGERLVAAAPAYLKHHSMGEYIYDFAWAQAASQLGLEYYPKLLVGAPLSPATCPRLLVAPGEDATALRRALLDAAVALAHEEGCSSVHVLYPTEEEADGLEEAGFARRLTLQFHWQNPGYRSFEEYLGRFDSKRRNQLKREVRAPGSQGIQLTTVRGEALLPEHAAHAFRFYAATCERHAWGRVQLTPDFFARVFRTLPDAVEVVTAQRDGRLLAGAFNLAWGDVLYGRYWGSDVEVPFLHFNVCLYHSVDECIRLGRRRFEPGAGGEHKIARGFTPVGVHSAHLVFDPRLDNAVRRFLAGERRHHARVIEGAEEVAGMKPWDARP
ncbi:MAG: GNAT family N-acetyltransferase [Myxococcaceae bacterium]|nr:GNAT family N-acetyltransferase [Myxococcaceae bacterium]MCI0669121.1 GNAT family N-acetyltransferase [Myxococcaceae bacterium]